MNGVDHKSLFCDGGPPGRELAGTSDTSRLRCTDSLVGVDHRLYALASFLRQRGRRSTAVLRVTDSGAILAHLLAKTCGFTRSHRDPAGAGCFRSLNSRLRFWVIVLSPLSLRTADAKWGLWQRCFGFVGITKCCPRAHEFARPERQGVINRPLHRDLLCADDHVEPNRLTLRRRSPANLVPI